MRWLAFRLVEVAIGTQTLLGARARAAGATTRERREKHKSNKQPMNTALHSAMQTHAHCDANIPILRDAVFSRLRRHAFATLHCFFLPRLPPLPLGSSLAVLALPPASGRRGRRRGRRRRGAYLGRRRRGRRRCGRRRCGGLGVEAQAFRRRPTQRLQGGLLLRLGLRLDLRRLLSPGRLSLRRGLGLVGVERYG